MKPESTRRVVTGEPRYIEVEKHGRTRLVLMQKVGVITETPEWTEPVLASENVVSPSLTELTFAARHHPREVWGEAHWEPVEGEPNE